MVYFIWFIVYKTFIKLIKHLYCTNLESHFVRVNGKNSMNFLSVIVTVENNAVAGQELYNHDD